MGKEKVLIIEDRFPMSEKERIEKEIGLELVIAPTYGEGIKCIEDPYYRYIITDIGLEMYEDETRKEDDSNDLFASFASASVDREKAREFSLSHYRYILDKTSDEISKRKEELKISGLEEIKNKELRQCARLYPNSYINLTDSALERLAKQGGLDIAYKLHNQKNRNFTVFTNDIHHAHPALGLMIIHGIIPVKEYLQVVKEIDQKEGSIWPEAIYIGPYKKLAVGKKDKPENWIELLKTVVERK